jgi:hypothetical protein
LLLLLRRLQPAENPAQRLTKATGIVEHIAQATAQPCNKRGKKLLLACRQSQVANRQNIVEVLQELGMKLL